MTIYEFSTLPMPIQIYFIEIIVKEKLQFKQYGDGKPGEADQGRGVSLAGGSREESKGFIVGGAVFRRGSGQTCPVSD